MNDPQTWTLLGVFGALFVALVGYSSHSTKTCMEALGTRLDARIDLSAARTAARFATLEERLETLDRTIDERFTTLGRKIDTEAGHLAEVSTVRLDAVDHRLTAVEDDLKIVKAHLLCHPAT